MHNVNINVKQGFIYENTVNKDFTGTLKQQITF